MTISLKPASTSSPLDGLLGKSQSRDLETIQPSSFSEVFKDEEKKLQKEQETNSFSVAAVLAGNPVLSIIESTPVLNSEIGTDNGNSEKQTVLQAESVATDLTDLSSGAVQTGLKKTVVGEKTAVIETNIFLPIEEIAKAAFKAAENIEIPAVTKLKSNIEVKVENPGPSITSHVEKASEKLESEIKTGEIQSRVPVTSGIKMVVTDAQSDKSGVPTAFRLEVASEKPVMEAKTVPVRSHMNPAPATIDMAVPSLVIADTAKAVSAIQNQKTNDPTLPGAQVASEKPDVEVMTVEIQQHVPTGGTSNREISAPEIQNEKPYASTPVRVEIIGEKTVVESKMVESKPRVGGSAPVISDKAEAPEIQSEKTDLPIYVDLQAAGEKPGGETKTDEGQSRVSALGTSGTAKAMPGIQNDNSGIQTVLDAQVTGEKMDTESKAVIQQPAKSIEVKTQGSVTAMSVSDIHRQSEKASVGATYEEPEQKFDPITYVATTVNETVVGKTTEKLTTSQVNVQSSEVVQQIMSQMKVRIKSGTSSMRLQLNPKELGGIEVQMIRSAEGVSVTFFAEQASTGHLLETQMNQLRQSLKDAGVQLTGLNINQQNQPKQEGGFFKQRPFLGQYFQDDSPPIETANKEWERRERIGGSLNEVDYLI